MGRLTRHGDTRTRSPRPRGRGTHGLNSLSRSTAPTRHPRATRTPFTHSRFSSLSSRSNLTTSRGTRAQASSPPTHPVYAVATRSRNAVPPFCTRDPPAIPSHPTPAGGARLSCVCVATCVRRHLRYPSLQPQAAGPRLHAWPCSPGSSLSPPLSLLRPPVRRLHMGLRAVYYQRGSRHLRVTASSARGASAVRGRASP